MQEIETKRKICHIVKTKGMPTKKKNMQCYVCLEWDTFYLRHIHSTCIQPTPTILNMQGKQIIDQDNVNKTSKYPIVYN